MAEGLNRVMLLGNLGADPELKVTQGGQAVHGRAAPDNRMFRLCFLNAVLPPQAILRPRRLVLPVQQHHVKVLGLGEFAQLVNLLRRINVWPCGHL